MSRDKTLDKIQGEALVEILSDPDLCQLSKHFHQRYIYEKNKDILDLDGFAIITKAAIQDTRCYHALSLFKYYTGESVKEAMEKDKKEMQEFDELMEKKW